MIAASAIRGYLVSQQTAMLSLVEKLVGIESYATQAEGTNAVGDVLCRELEAIGFTTANLTAEAYRIIGGYRRWEHQTQPANCARGWRIMSKS